MYTIPMPPLNTFRSAIVFILQLIATYRPSGHEPASHCLLDFGPYCTALIHN